VDSELIVPVLAAGPFRLRPFRLTDVDLIRKAAQDLHSPDHDGPCGVYRG
jgi:hypothetical protein